MLYATISSLISENLVDFDKQAYDHVDKIIAKR